VHFVHYLEGVAMDHAGEGLRRSGLFGYGLAIVSVGMSLALAVVLLRFNSPLPFTGFALTAIAITFWYAGTNPGIIAVILSTLARSYFFPPAIAPFSRMLYDSIFLVFALVMFRITRTRNRLEVEVAEQTVELAQTNTDLKLEIAERKRAEDRTRLIIDTIPTMAWTIWPDGAVDFVNQRWLDYTGLTLEEIIAEHTSALHREDVSRALEKWHPDMAAGRPSEDEMRLRRADGEYRWFLVRTAPLRDEQGNPVKWYGVSVDIEDRKQAEEEVRRLSGRLLRSQDDERRRIARELHDSTGQNLVALATMIGQLDRSISLGPSGEQQTSALLSECQALADQLIREVRTLSYVLYPPVLDEAGIEDAIRDYAKGFTNRSGIQVDLDLSPGVGRVGRDIELTVFRVVQEALTNVQRHSSSQQAKIRIYRNSNLTLEISDSGRGLSATAQKGKNERRFEFGVGIQSMRDRVNLIGGQLGIDSASGGTTVRVTIPLGGEQP
jgi:PAS domain S-box-containing protein